MHTINIAKVLIALASVALAQTQPKANEYKSTDCSGSINFAHKNFDLEDVTMDDTSHSVYLAVTGDDTWQAWSDKTSNGGSCTGTNLGTFSHLDCNDLDTTFSSRIRCVRYVNGP